MIVFNDEEVLQIPPDEPVYVREGDERKIIALESIANSLRILVELATRELEEIEPEEADGEA